MFPIVLLVAVFFSCTDAAAGFLFLSYPLSIKNSIDKKKIFNGANYDENTGSVGFSFADACASEYSKKKECKKERMKHAFSF